MAVYSEYPPAVWVFSNTPCTSAPAVARASIALPMPSGVDAALVEVVGLGNEPDLDTPLDRVHQRIGDDDVIQLERGDVDRDASLADIADERLDDLGLGRRLVRGGEVDADRAGLRGRQR